MSYSHCRCQSALSTSPLPTASFILLHPFHPTSPPSHIPSILQPSFPPTQATLHTRAAPISSHGRLESQVWLAGFSPFQEKKIKDKFSLAWRRLPLKAALSCFTVSFDAIALICAAEAVWSPGTPLDRRAGCFGACGPQPCIPAGSALEPGQSSMLCFAHPEPSLWESRAELQWGRDRIWCWWGATRIASVA